ncbi:MAG: hypothetical protein ABIN48_01800 [Ginsengibacter sp.]
MSDKKREANKQLMRYAGLGMQFLVGIGLALYAGSKLDKWLKIEFPLFVWLTPLIIIIGVIIKVVVDTGRK